MILLLVLLATLGAWQARLHSASLAATPGLGHAARTGVQPSRVTMRWPLGRHRADTQLDPPGVRPGIWKEHEDAHVPVRPP